MSLITWRSQYAVDVDRIDDQHQQLVALLNDFHDAMRDGRGDEKVVEVLAELEEYTKFHFQDEAELATDCGFSRDCRQCHKAHQDAHAAFTNRVETLREQYENGDTTVPMKTLRFLRQWTTEHITEMDQQLGRYINDDVDPQTLSPIDMETSLNE